MTLTNMVTVNATFPDKVFVVRVMKIGASERTSVDATVHNLGSPNVSGEDSMRTT